MPDMRTSYLNIELKNPLVPSASPLSRSLVSARQLEDAGAAAIVMYSLFEEELTQQDEVMNRFLPLKFRVNRLACLGQLFFILATTGFEALQLFVQFRDGLIQLLILTLVLQKQLFSIRQRLPLLVRRSDILFQIEPLQLQ